MLDQVTAEVICEAVRRWGFYARQYFEGVADGYEGRGRPEPDDSNSRRAKRMQARVRGYEDGQAARQLRLPKEET